MISIAGASSASSIALSAYQIDHKLRIRGYPLERWEGTPTAIGPSKSASGARPSQFSHFRTVSAMLPMCGRYHEAVHCTYQRGDRVNLHRSGGVVRFRFLLSRCRLALASGRLHGANPGLTFYPAMLLASVFLGWREALLVLGLSVSVGAYLFLRPDMYLLPVGWTMVGEYEHRNYFCTDRHSRGACCRQRTPDNSISRSSAPCREYPARRRRDPRDRQETLSHRGR